MYYFVIVISDFVRGVEWVAMSFRLEISVSDVSIVDVTERGGSHLRQVSWLGPLDVIEIHDVSSLVVSLLLGLRPLYIIMTDGISDELGWSDWSHLHLWQGVRRVQWIVVSSS